MHLSNVTLEAAQGLDFVAIAIPRLVAEPAAAGDQNGHSFLFFFLALLEDWASFDPCVELLEELDPCCVLLAVLLELCESPAASFTCVGGACGGCVMG